MGKRKPKAPAIPAPDQKTLVDGILDAMEAAGYVVVAPNTEIGEERAKKLLNLIGLNAVCAWLPDQRQEMQAKAELIISLEPDDDDLKAVCHELSFSTAELEFDPGHPVIMAAARVALNDNAFDGARAVGDLRRELQNAGLFTVTAVELRGRNV